MVGSSASTRRVCRRRSRLVASLLGILALAGLPQMSWAGEKPKIRALTAFVRLERARHREQIQHTLGFLRQAREAFRAAGYEVQTLRITTQPFPEYTRGMTQQEVLAFFREYNELVVKEGFLCAIGPAMLSDDDDPGQAELLGEILVAAPNLDASLAVAGKDGVHWKAVRAAARLVKFLAERTPRSQGAFQFAATAMVPEFTPFYPGSYHTGAGRQFAVAVQTASVVAEAFRSVHDAQAARRALESALGEQAQAIEALARRVEKESGWTYEGIDLSTAPLKEVSIGAAIESFTGRRFGSSGTMTAATLITDVLHSLPVKRAGYSGLMIPVLEDQVLAQRWTEGVYSIDALLAYSAVCGTGLDTVPLPGNVSVGQLAQIIGDMASLAVKLRKPLTARLLPVAGKKAGERSEFDDPMLENAILQPLP